LGEKKIGNDCILRGRWNLLSCGGKTEAFGYGGGRRFDGGKGEDHLTGVSVLLRY